MKMNGRNMMNRLKRTTVILCVIVPVLTSLAGATIETLESSGTIQNVQDKFNRIFTSESKQNARITSMISTSQDSFTLCGYADTENSSSLDAIALSFPGRDNALHLESDPLLLDGVDLDDKNVLASMTYVDSRPIGNDQNNTLGYAIGNLGSHSIITDGGGSAMPEPGTLAILILGGGMILVRHKRKKQIAS